MLNGEEGVEIFLEGADQGLNAFVQALRASLRPPRRSRRSKSQSKPLRSAATNSRFVRASGTSAAVRFAFHRTCPSATIACASLFDPADRRYFYPYINCTNCGPRYTVILGLPYDRSNTTMQRWPLDDCCAANITIPPIGVFTRSPSPARRAGPHITCEPATTTVRGTRQSIRSAATTASRSGKIVAVKGLGGYHLACDARNADAVRRFANRKYRKEKPFALMAATSGSSRGISSTFPPKTEALLTSAARPIVIAPAKVNLPDVAPDNHELGVMLPYTPLHHLLFAAGAPEVLVMTSANRSSEPIAYRRCRRARPALRNRRRFPDRRAPHRAPRG